MIWMISICATSLPSFAQAQNAIAGKAIFNHVWIPGDPLSPNGDGLGPVYNAQSCAQCHYQGGVGGGGDLKDNMDFLTAIAKTDADKKRLVATHPGFLNSNGGIKGHIVLHRFSLDQVYSNMRAKMLVTDGAIAQTAKEFEALKFAIARKPVEPVKFNAHVGGLRSQRNSTALFGAGLINKVTIKDLVKMVPTKSPNVSGRISVLADPLKVGRFGWRGQTESVEEFVAAACANELGLETSTHPQFADPRKPGYRPPGLDINNTDLQSLIDFVKTLPRPEAVLPTNPEMEVRVKQGRELFDAIGCTDCHVENRASIKEIYSDLLLHDMGKSLADPILPTAPVVRVTVPPGKYSPEYPATVDLVDMNADGIFDLVEYNSPFKKLKPRTEIPRAVKIYSGETISAGSLGSSAAIVLAQEWRTPPLWGVAASAPYMHDGRAPTLLEAILVHGGESQDSVDGFVGLAHEEQLKLLEFLGALKAPK